MVDAKKLVDALENALQEKPSWGRNQVIELVRSEYTKLLEAKVIQSSKSEEVEE